MGDGGDPGLTVEAYATLLASLADPEADRAAVLAAYGLDEASWEPTDAAWQARLSAAAEAIDGEEPTAPPLLVAFAEAFAAAQRAQAQELLSFERYVELTRVVTRGGPIGEELKRRRVTLPEYLRAHEHWMRRMAEDPALAERFAGHFGSRCASRSGRAPGTRRRGARGGRRSCGLRAIFSQYVCISSVCAGSSSRKAILPIEIVLRSSGVGSRPLSVHRLSASSCMRIDSMGQ